MKKRTTKQWDECNSGFNLNLNVLVLKIPGNVEGDVFLVGVYAYGYISFVYAKVEV